MSRVLVIGLAAGAVLLLSCGKSEPLTTRCTPGLERCESECVDFRKDRENCGACGVTCASGEICSAGVCALSCQQGLSECGGECSALQKDPENCGACGRTCQASEVCSKGACVSACAMGTTAC